MFLTKERCCGLRHRQRRQHGCPRMAVLGRAFLPHRDHPHFVAISSSLGHSTVGATLTGLAPCCTPWVRFLEA